MFNPRHKKGVGICTFEVFAFIPVRLSVTLKQENGWTAADFSFEG